MSTNGESRPDYLHWLEEIETKGVNLTTWEEEFVESIRDRFNRGWDTLSDRQAEILERIYAQRTA